MSLSVEQAQSKMLEAFVHLEDELKKITTGRANPAMLDGVMVKAYGQAMPLKHLANVVASDSQMLSVTPFDPSNLAAISTAISETSLGLNPSDDGHIVRVPVPPLTQERRQELVKMLGSVVEDARVSLRAVRHEILNGAKDDKKSGLISEDDLSRLEKRVEEMMSEFNEKVDSVFQKKQSEIMTI
jgi:ribosome recycling factor